MRDFAVNARANHCPSPYRAIACSTHISAIVELDSLDWHGWAHVWMPCRVASDAWHVSVARDKDPTIKAIQASNRAVGKSPILQQYFLGFHTLETEISPRRLGAKSR